MCGGKSEPHRGKSAEVFVFLFSAEREREQKQKVVVVVVVVRRRRLMEKMRTRAILKGRRRPGKVTFRVRIPTDRIIRDSFKGQKRNKKKSQHLTALHLFPILYLLFCVCLCVCVCVCRIRNAFVDEKLAVKHTVVWRVILCFIHMTEDRREPTGYSLYFNTFNRISRRRRRLFRFLARVWARRRRDTNRMTGRLSVSKQKANLFQFFFLCCVEN
jgi:hypothetical protein